MINAFDRIVIAVPDLAAAITAYQGVLGSKFWLVPETGGQPRAWLGLANVVMELCEQPVERAVIIGVVFADESESANERVIHNARQLSLGVCRPEATMAFRYQQPQCQNLELAVDHLVLHTNDAQASIQLFSVALGLRLALDKNAPEWGGRMLFFRLGKLTLEVIERTDADPAEADHFWGIAYRCPTLSCAVKHFADEGIDVSPIRNGRKPGTQVASLKSHTLGIPTLLIQQAITV